LIKINKKRHETGESLPSIMQKLGSQLDLQIYLHPYEKEIRDCGVGGAVMPKQTADELKIDDLDKTPLTYVNTVLSLGWGFVTFQIEN
jgi:hypothetical protein